MYTKHVTYQIRICSFYNNIIIREHCLLCQLSFVLLHLNETNDMFRSRTLANYIVWQLVRNFEHVLPEPFELAKLKLYSAIYGVGGIPPRWRRCVDRLGSAMMFVVDSLYVDEYFSSGDKKKVCRDSLKHLQNYKSSLQQLVVV